MKTNRFTFFYNYSFVIIFFIGLFQSSAQKQMEDLDRGVLAVRKNSSEVLISWRIFASEFENASYNVYRGSTKINPNPITGSSNYIDAIPSNLSYSITAIINGEEQEGSEPVEVWSDIYKKIPLTIPSGGVTPNGESYTYTANDASVGDLDGDKQYDIVLKWMPTNANDNSPSQTGPTILQGLKMDGTILWTINLGKNIRSGPHYTQFLVYDLDGDGKAEVACKTADGTVDGLGTILGDPLADYRQSDGMILSGPEFLTVFSGETGKELATTYFAPSRGSVCNWGDCYGNRVDRFLACIAYLDGERPSLVFSRGYYTRVGIRAIDYRDGQLQERWYFDTLSGNGNEVVYGQGNHSITVGDVDGDGKDEIQFGSAAIDDDGTVLYSTGFGHGDASHLGDFDPTREGLEYFMVHEEANNPNVPQIDYRDPKTGEVFWQVEGSGDIGRGVIADIDPNYLGAEMWASNGSGIHNIAGEVISTTYPTTAGNGWSYNMFAWYDGDLLREMVDKTVITKWNASKGSTDRILTAYNYDNVSVTSNNGTKANPCLIADILGDWREEIIWRKSDNTELVIFTTPYYTDERIFTLMHDPLYRTSIAWQNVGYNQPAHTSFYLGHGMTTPATPNIYLAKEGTLSVNDKPKIKISSIKMYPNPTTGKLSFSGINHATIQVYDSLGRTFLKKNINANQILDLSTYPKGLYFVKVIQLEKVKVFKTLLK